MSSEERIIRPFLGIDRVQSALNGLRLLVGDDVLEPDESRELLPHEFLNSRVSLLLAPTPEDLKQMATRLADGIDEMGLETSSVELLVILSSPRLKIADPVLRVALDGLDSAEIRQPLATGTHRPRALRAQFGGCVVEAYAILAENRRQELLRPWRKGTWLARCRFALRTDTGSSGFVPIAMTNGDRERLRIPRDAIRFVELEDSALASGVGDEALRLFVDEGLLAQLAAEPASTSAKTFQRQLFLDAVSAIVLSASRETTLATVTMAEIEESLLGRLIVKMAGRQTGENEAARRSRQEDHLALVRNEPDIFLARVEALVSPKKDLSALLSGGEP